MNTVMEMMGKKEEEKLTFLELLVMSINNILGSGVFVVLGKAIYFGGNKAFLALFFVGVLTIYIAAVYSEIFERYNHSPICEFLCVKESLGKNIGSLVAYVLYIFPMFTATTMTTTIAKNILYLFPFSLGEEGSFLRKAAEILISIFLLALMSITNYAGIETSTAVSYMIGLGLVSLLVFIIMIGSRKLNVHDICCLAPETKIYSNEFFLSVMMSFFLFNGYDFTIKMREETNTPLNNLRVLYLSILTSFFFCAVLMCVCLSVFRFQDFQHMYDVLPNIVLLVTKSHYLFWIVFLIGVIVMYNTAFLLLISSSRYLKSMGEKNEIIWSEAFKSTNNPQHSPTFAIVFSFFFCAFLSIINNETLLAIGSNASAILILLLITISLFLLRMNQLRPDYLNVFNTHRLGSEN